MPICLSSCLRRHHVLPGLARRTLTPLLTSRRCLPGSICDLDPPLPAYMRIGNNPPTSFIVDSKPGRSSSLSCDTARCRIRRYGPQGRFSLPSNRSFLKNQYGSIPTWSLATSTRSSLTQRNAANPVSSGCRSIYEPGRREVPSRVR